jgi:hypothetical protein
MKRMLIAPVVAILTLIMTLAPAGAGWGWCPVDPIVELNGTEVEIWVAIPEPFEEHVTGPVDFKIGVPKEVSTKVVFLDEGYNGYSEVVKFVPNGTSVNPDGTFQVDVHARVPLKKMHIDGLKAEMMLWVVFPDGSTQEWHGMANNMKVSFTMQGDVISEP